jgi:hypothetical protein
MKPIAERLDLSDFRYPMEPIPKRVERAIEAGVESGRSFPFSDASRLLEEGGDGAGDTVVRQPDGTLFVACSTEMPGVTPDMWDWWFGWHGYTSERYQLWHPKAHLRSAMREDRRQVPGDRDRWIGNVSYVDEYIGPKLQRLAIAFQPPRSFGLDQAVVDTVGTAICARTALRRVHLYGGYLIHLVRTTPTGSEMLSRFWLGHIEAPIPGIRRPLDAILNSGFVRSRLLPDDDGLNLLRHCSDEMSHLARILPELHQRFGAASP